MSEEPGAALTAAFQILDQLARDGGPASGAARILPEHVEEVARQLIAELGAGASAHAARPWLTAFECKAATRFVPLDGRTLPLKPIDKFSTEEKHALGSWIEAQRKARARTPASTPPTRMPNEIRNAPAEVRHAWANKQARKG